MKGSDIFVFPLSQFFFLLHVVIVLDDDCLYCWLKTDHHQGFY
jgi:hypothetical protein